MEGQGVEHVVHVVGQHPSTLQLVLVASRGIGDHGRADRQLLVELDRQVGAVEAVDEQQVLGEDDALGVVRGHQVEPFGRGGEHDHRRELAGGRGVLAGGDLPGHALRLEVAGHGDRLVAGGLAGEVDELLLEVHGRFRPRRRSR